MKTKAQWKKELSKMSMFEFQALMLAIQETAVEMGLIPKEKK